MSSFSVHKYGFVVSTSAIIIGLVLLGAALTTGWSPSKQREGDIGRLHPNNLDILLMIFSQKQCMGLYDVEVW